MQDGLGRRTTPSLCATAVWNCLAALLLFYFNFHKIIISIQSGDRGYPLKPWFLMPIAHPQTVEEAHYNTVLACVRSVVECTIGILKGRWRCLDASGQRLIYEPGKVCKIILACCFLHNICLSHGLEMAEGGMHLDVPVNPPPLPQTHMSLCS